MTEEQAIRMVLENANKPRFIEDSRPWWQRLIYSIRFFVKPGKTLKKTIKEIGISGGIKF